VTVVTTAVLTGQARENRDRVGTELLSVPINVQGWFKKPFVRRRKWRRVILGEILVLVRRREKRE